MNRLFQTALLAILLAVAGCTEPDTYPLTGEECGPQDPVLDLGAADCGTPGLP